MIIKTILLSYWIYQDDIKLDTINNVYYHFSAKFDLTQFYFQTSKADAYVSIKKEEKKNPIVFK